jgi:MoxR-like ATPase
MTKDPTRPLEPVYASASRFVDSAIAHDDSVFTPGSAIWTLDHLREFHRLFIENIDLSADSFNVKLIRQLEDARPEVRQMAAELVFFHSLGVSNQGPVSKLAMIEPLLDTIGMTFPDELVDAVAAGVAHHGAGLAHRDAYMRCLVRFMLASKELDPSDRAKVLSDPQLLRSLVYELPPDADAAQRNMILHLIRPDDFEAIALDKAKNRIVATFAELVSGDSTDTDAQLADIREALSGKYGEQFNFYNDDLKSQWGEVPDPPSPVPDPVETIGALVDAAFPETELQQLLLGLMAAAVQRAHSAAPASWGISADTRHLALNLNVGRLATFAIRADEVMVALDAKSLDDQVCAQLDEASTRQGRVYASLESSRYWFVRPDLMPALVDQIKPALLQHVDRATSAVKVSPYARSHSAAAIEYLSSVVGADLPVPERRRLSTCEGTGWDGFVAWAARIFDDEHFDREERDYKLEIGERIRTARTALRDNDPEWASLLKQAFTRHNNLTPWRAHSKFYGWAADEPNAARHALEVIWSAGDVDDRIREFCDLVPDDVVSGVGTRLAIASFLLMVEPTTHPIFRPSPFQEAWRLTGWDTPSSDADEAESYQSALGFMDELQRRLADVGVQIRDRLDAQGLIWSVSWNDPPQYLDPDERHRMTLFKTGKVDQRPEVPDPPPEEPTLYVEPSFDEILEHFSNAGLRIESETLLRYHLSLKTRGFVILSGVSGTGKSWLTRLYSEAVGGEFCLVPVAPNWTTNEDLLGYHNPVADAYVDTEFTRFLRRAADSQAAADEAGEPSKPFFFVLDEMNLARVEYYLAKFLSVMEARDHEGVALELSEAERIPMPKNLYAIGTVNVDETTHGFADKVYDRAQVIELPITSQDMASFVGDATYAARLLEVWMAVSPVAPFAYRVADEVARYVTAATEAGLEWQVALDHQVLQKVLPKLARVDERVGLALQALIDVCADGLPHSEAKARSTLRNLEAYGFAAYF